MTILDVFKSRIQVAQRILITTHEFPDADGIGSEIALCLALREYGKQSYCVNEEPLLERYQYLDQDKVVMGSKDFMKDHYGLCSGPPHRRRHQHERQNWFSDGQICEQSLDALYRSSPLQGPRPLQSLHRHNRGRYRTNDR